MKTMKLKQIKNRKLARRCMARMDDAWEIDKQIKNKEQIVEITKPTKQNKMAVTSDSEADVYGERHI